MSFVNQMLSFTTQFFFHFSPDIKNLRITYFILNG